jgi:diadenosine tetraphosphate (Ap4A) HIT family hydrolase
MVNIADAGEYEQFRIKNYEHFAVFLHKNQYYLGRCYIYLHRSNILDLHDMLPAEQKEFFHVGHDLKHALKRAFDPDKFNDASLGNEHEHLHIHIIPRYRSPRNFDGVKFTDENWGKNYVPYNKDFEVSLETLLKIKDRIGSELRSPRF